MTIYRTIGGVFPLERDRSIASQPLTSRSFWQGCPALFTVNARSALLLLVQNIRPQKIWLPSFLCPELLIIPGKTTTPYSFYSVDEELQPDLASLRAKRGDLVVAISYFGVFPFPSDTIEFFRSDGIVVIEDASQDFFAAYRDKSPADYLLLSPRKFMGVPDGGILVSLRSPMEWREGLALQNAPADWFDKAMAACEGRKNSEDSNWYGAFVQSESISPVGPYKMSDITRRIIDSIPVSEWADHRRRNYQALANRLAQFAMRPELEPNLVPLGFPIRCERRDAVRSRLFESSIFPPVHWILPNHPLSHRIMTLPCDQRYSEEDMARMATAFLAAVEEAGI